jgi:hypothetical protein
MDTFSACLALGPLAIYLLLLGAINLASRPLVVSGTRELVAIGLAVSGMVIVGPMQLFMPQEAAARFGMMVWALLVCFYVLCLTLLVMVMRPRLIVYNTSLDQLQPVLRELAGKLDHESVWAGRALSMPQWKVHLLVENFAPLCNVSLVATTSAQSASGWRRLESALREAVRQVPVTRRSHGLWLALCGLSILLVLAMRIVDDPQTIARGLDRILNP